jgi:hypothetical protein
MTDHDQHNTQGVPSEDADADTASGGAPEPPTPPTTKDMPVDNPIGG